MAFKYKMAIVVRKNLNLSEGKLAGQVSHAACGCYKMAKEDEFDTLLNEDIAGKWFDEGQPKIILQVPTEEDLHQLVAKCILQEVPYYEVRDMGLTELEPNTFTCIGIGPDLSDRINRITGNLKLWR
jgi:PTH2 family peptidyl-tRNA hydrolase